ncbi:hypothetical protein KC721_04025, partial [Candidatus Woesebacteria bacterium]|nr:hypothetical protein [Candidatus Woesebacteria bacterium]
MPSSKTSRFQQLVPSEIRFPLATIQVISVLSIIIATLGYFILPPQIPLFYSLAQPTQQLVPKLFIGILPGIAVLFGTLNTILCIEMRRYDQLLLKLFAWFAVVISVVILLSLV